VSNIYRKTNFETLAQLLIRTWGERAKIRAKRLAGQNREGVRLLTAVSAQVREKACES
jgi:hypothetical protein